MRLSQVWALTGTLLCAGCASASADEPAPLAQQGDQPQPVPSMRSQAAREALRARLRASLARGKDAMALEQRADGIRIARHNGGFQHATLVVRDADGKRSQSCTDDLAAAEGALMGAPK